MKQKIKVGVIFGGRSFEHEVSLVSARAIIENLNKKKYQVFPIGINKDGRWLFKNLAKDLLNGKKIREGRGEVIIPKNIIKQIDIFFPVLHGVYGEDGTIQGLIEMLDKPYVGAPVLASSLGMDKVIQKILVNAYKIPTAKFFWFRIDDFLEKKKKILKLIKKRIGFPCFIKPANGGSSVGVSKAKNETQLLKAIKEAKKYDFKILIEKAIPHAREIEISVLGNEKPIVSLPGEIRPSNEFYDYQAKYVDGKSIAIIPAKLERKLIKKIQKYALTAYKALDCAGMARIDFLLDDKTKKIYFNEINTIPGFTPISMYPKLWELNKINFSKLLDQLIKYAFERYKKKKKLLTSYRVLNKWYVSEQKNKK
jgi:D-alanine-D-alanine ligase